MSLRLDHDVAAALRAAAGRLGVTVSDLLREAAEQIVTPPVSAPVAAPHRDVTTAGHPQTAFGPAVTFGYAPPPSQTWGCEHMTISGPVFVAPSVPCGCEMRLQ